MNLFNCNSEWPICLYDFTYKNRIPTYFCFKVEIDLTMNLLEDYFSFNQQPNKISRTLEEKQYSSRPIRNCDLLIERNKHLCVYSKQFVPKFKALFNDKSCQLLDSDIFSFNISDESSIRNKSLNFLESVIATEVNIEQSESEVDDNNLNLKERRVTKNEVHSSFLQELTHNNQ